MPSIAWDQAQDQKMTDLIDALHSCNCHLEAMTKQLKEYLRLQLPAFVDEKQYIVAPSLETSITLTPQVSGIIRVGTIIAYAVNASTLILGDRVIPLPAGANIIRDTGILLYRRDKRQLTQSPAGAMSLEIMGVEIPERSMW